jgi:hypothetical protein
MASIIPRAIARSLLHVAKRGRKNTNMVARYFHPPRIVVMFAGGSGSILAELVIHARLRIRKVAAPEGRLFDCLRLSIAAGASMGCPLTMWGLAGSSSQPLNRTSIATNETSRLRSFHRVRERNGTHQLSDISLDAKQMRLQLLLRRINTPSKRIAVPYRAVQTSSPCAKRSRA